ncbi:hypothetical protein EBZ80_02660 [bacterium]|nr:hypothetical protein [bacterium]
MLKKFLSFALLLVFSTAVFATTDGVRKDQGSKIHIRVGQRLSSKQRDLVQSARRLLDEAPVSYVYGGNRLGTAADCEACNQCLESERPSSDRRLRVCAECARCSVDCSHFTQLVFERAGIQHPYLTSKDMAALPAVRLERDFGFLSLPPDPASATPGDLLVYKGHVVLLERSHAGGKGDIIHATGGRDIKAPGQGIQRERWADLGQFRGPLLRILRHQSLTQDR